MDTQSFINEYRGRRIDFAKDGKYTAADLISEYLWLTQDVKFEVEGVSLEALYNHVPDDLTATLYTVQDPTPKDGDIVFLNGYQHWGIATGNQDNDRFEILEQNAVGSETGVGDDAIRENYYLKADLHGLWRMRHAAVNKPQPVLSPVEQEIQDEVLAIEPKVTPKYRPPTGALHVPRAIQLKTLVKVELDSYPSPGLAQKREKPTGRKIRPGMHEFDELKFGMAKLAGENLWINPLDNVVAPKYERPPQEEYKPDAPLNGAKEAEENYLDFTDQHGKLTEKYYTAKAQGAFVIDFATSNTRRMPATAHVWLAGITQVGGNGYGIATKVIEMEPVRWVGILMGDLYEDDTFNKETTVEERQVMRTLKLQDHITLTKAKVQKRFMDISNKRKVQ